jgi:hypothetical protein
MRGRSNIAKLDRIAILMNLTVNWMALFSTRLFYHEQFLGNSKCYPYVIIIYLLFPIVHQRVTILKL